jgi:hypothetical protein
MINCFRPQWWPYMEQAGEPGATGGAPAPADPTAAPAAPAAPAPADPPAAPAWTDGLDAATKAMIEKDGYKSPADLVAKVRGYQAPESPDAYEVPVPEGESPEFAAAIKPLFHKAGLSPTQAKALAEGWNEMQAAERAADAQRAADAEREAAALAERQQGDLKREWGDRFDANTELAKRAIRSGMAAAGLKEDGIAEMIDGLSKAHGFAAVHKFFAALGAPMAEAPAHGMGTPAGLGAKSFYDKSNMNP